ncbi:cysteine hydrolase [Curtobacterium flaccumfaciens pv. flaccumfaciens]|uniref:cysteine hydrolase family protein n=1 Tax=Curtobacterium flaccumfaciens TaxID=2035 RepID=UPI001BD19740|nr:isochorismatase family cysteine hydrolase [Curtobacterium flaccumfaciens]QVG65565.1 cysteine hydrolase [Curtobacterium flaccumfaciens pv. flaccumfaciens]
MSIADYDARSTALLLLDPYNDFLTEGGKLFPRFQAVAEANNLVPNLVALTETARDFGIQVMYVPHRRWRTGDFEAWAFPNPSQLERMETHTFEDGTWGGQFRDDLLPELGDVIIAEHWAQNGFVNTDLALQLQQHGVTHTILAGMVANTCIESTGRYAMELGHHVTLVSDATAAVTPEMMHAAHVLNGPTYAHSIVTTEELTAALRESRGCR